MKRMLPLVVALSFLAQNTGAADLAAAFGAARTPHLAYPGPSGRMPFHKQPLQRTVAPKPGPTLSQRLNAALSSYSDDVYAVAMWALETETAAAAAPAPKTETVTVAAVAQASTSVDPQAAAAFEKPSDRILIIKDDAIVGVANALGNSFEPRSLGSALRPTHPRVEGLWFKGAGFKFRVNYLDAYGTTFGEPKGFIVDSVYSRESWIPIKEQMPQELRRLAPIYFHGMSASYELEIVAGEEPVRGLKSFVRQEELDGTKLTEAEQIGTTVDLAPGERVVLKGQTFLRGRGQARVNFERTHVVISGADGSVLADEASAGLVDPPGGR